MTLETSGIAGLPSDIAYKLSKTMDSVLCLLSLQFAMTVSFLMTFWIRACRLIEVTYVHETHLYVQIYLLEYSFLPVRLLQETGSRANLLFWKEASWKKMSHIQMAKLKIFIKK